MNIDLQCIVTVQAAREAWDASLDSPNESFDIALGIGEKSKDTPLHQPYAWASLTCGWILTGKGKLDEGEALLAAAL